MRPETTNLSDTPCPCGSKLQYKACCQPLHLGDNEARTAEALMRSRYSAYAMRDLPYLKKTWHPSHLPADLSLEQSNWIGLKVLETKFGGEYDDEGWVRFIARYKINGKAHRMEEYSYFVRINALWVYVDGR